MVDYRIECIGCKKLYSVIVHKEDITKWEQGASAQNAFPYLSDSDRELLISNICPICWDSAFDNEEEDD